MTKKTIFLFLLAIIIALVGYSFIKETKNLSHISNEPYKFQDYPVTEDFFTLTPIKWDSNQDITKEPNNYRDDWKTIFANYTATTSNNFAGHYKRFTLPDGNFRNFTLVDVKTGEIIDNDYLIPGDSVLDGDSNYIFRPDSNLMEISVDNGGSFVFNGEELRKKIPNLIADRAYMYLLLTNGKLKFLGTYVYNGKDYIRIDEMLDTKNDGEQIKGTDMRVFNSK